MHVPNSIIDPATAPDGKPYIVAFRDDDWDHWSDLHEASTYRGERFGGRWLFSPLGSGAQGRWSYADEEIVVVAELEETTAMVAVSGQSADQGEPEEYRGRHRAPETP